MKKITLYEKFSITCRRAGKLAWARSKRNIRICKNQNCIVFAIMILMELLVEGSLGHLTLSVNYYFSSSCTEFQSVFFDVNDDMMTI